MSATLPVGPVELLAAASLVALAMGLSLALRLGLAGRLLVASARTVVQLLAVGYLLRFVFALDAPAPVLAILAIMTAIAGWAALGRVSRTVPGGYLLALGSIAAATLVATAVTTQLALRIDPWYRPQVLIPLAGMILGNALTGISLAMERLLTGLEEQRDVVEERLALAATPFEAARPLLVAALRQGMIPLLNTMTVAGIVSLPGMMTGQILAGADPLQAVAYQIVVMFMLCGATALGAVLLGLTLFRRLCAPFDRIAFERIRPRAR